MQKKFVPELMRLLGTAVVALIGSHFVAGSARAESAKEWIAYGGDWANTRYSTLNSINTKNVKGLKVAWAFPLGVLEGQETSPLIIDGTMYVTSPRGPKYVFALDAKTGTLRWRYAPEMPVDIATAVCCGLVNRGVAKVLTDLTIGGNTVQALMTADRNGFFYVLDRKTGKLISATPFVNVNWAKGINADGRPVENPEKRPRKDIWARDVCPSFYGGKNFPPVSYSSETRLVYIPTFNVCMDEVGRDAGEPKKGILFLGTEFDAGKYGPGGHGGEFVAWDPVARKKVWGVTEPKPFLGGALSTAGGLVFYGNMDGELKALDAKSGDLLWRFQTGSGINQGPVSYEIAGKQYIAVASGRLVGPPSFMGEQGKKLLASTVEGSTLFVFELPN